MNQTHLKVEPTTPKPALAGHKRDYNSIQISHNMQLQPPKLIKNPNIPNSFASHLPPLNKKIKLTHYPNNIHIQPVHTHTHNHTLAHTTNHNNLFNNNLNINTLDLDTLISHVANLRNINLQQINVLNNLILATANNTTTQLQSQTAPNNIQNGPKQINLSEYKSCHQCKTKKDVKILFYCTKTRPCCNNTFKKKTCRKKYCKSCMSKYYIDADIAQLQQVKDCRQLQWKWECPACVGVCSCRACKRRRAQSNRIEPTIVQNHRGDVNQRMDYSGQEVQFIQQNVVHEQVIYPPTFNGNGSANINANVGTNELLQMVLTNPNLHVLFR